MPPTSARCLKYSLDYNPPESPEDMELWAIEFVNELVHITKCVNEFSYTYLDGDIFLYNNSNNKSLCYLIYMGLLLMESSNCHELKDMENHIANMYGYQAVCWPTIVRLYIIPMFISDITMSFSPAISQLSVSSEEL